MAIVFSQASGQEFGSEEVILPRSIPERVGVWRAKGRPLAYQGDDLFLYINGGAEIYHEYGFDNVIVQDYADHVGRSITLEVYGMNSPESAYGIYTFKQSLEGKELELGRGGCLEEYYLNFWKDRFLVTLTGFERDEETMEGLVRIAQAVDTLLPDAGGKPELLSRLPEGGLLKSSIKYFRGSLALFNSHRFFDENVFSLEEGVKADYAAGYSIFLFRYTDDGRQNEVFTQAKKSFEGNPGYTEYRSLDLDKVEVKTPEGKKIYMTHHGRNIILILGDGPLSAAQEVAGQIEAKLDSRE